MRKEDGAEMPPAKQAKVEPKLEVKAEKPSPSKPSSNTVNTANGSSTPKPVNKDAKVKEESKVKVKEEPKVKAKEDTGGRDSPAIVKIVKTDKKERVRDADNSK